MKTTMTVTFIDIDEGKKNFIVVNNPQHIPTIGSKIDMNMGEVAATVREVLYRYPTTNETQIFVVVV